MSDLQRRMAELTAGNSVDLASLGIGNSKASAPGKSDGRRPDTDPNLDRAVSLG